MSLTLHTLKPAKGARTKKFRIGRGNASGRGTTAGKGTKGQRARTGGRRGLKLKGLKQMLLSFPKLRGFKSHVDQPTAVPLERLVEAYASNEQIDLDSLKAKRLVPRIAQSAKIIGSTKLDKVLILMNLQTTPGAKQSIEAAGGSVTKRKSGGRPSKRAH